MFALSLVGCGQKPEEVPKRPAQQVEQPRTPAVDTFAERQAAEKVAEKSREAEAEKKTAEEKKTVTANVNNALDQLHATKKLELKEQQEIVALIPRDTEYLGSIANRALEKVAGGRYSEHQSAEISRLIDGMLLWAKKDIPATEKLFDAVVPALKMKAGLVVGLRDNVGLLNKPYSDKGFVAILACVQDSRELSLKDECRKVFTTFGVKFTPATEAGQADDVDRNAVYIIKFLNRRSLNGGEQFARLAQRLMLKVAK